MTEPEEVPAASNSADGCLVFGCALAFWLVVPFPFWLLGVGFAGQLIFLPETWDIISILWVIAFYAPLALMVFVAIDSMRSRIDQNAED